MSSGLGESFARQSLGVGRHSAPDSVGEHPDRGLSAVATEGNVKSPGGVSADNNFKGVAVFVVPSKSCSLLPPRSPLSPPFSPQSLFSETLNRSLFKVSPSSPLET